MKRNFFTILLALLCVGLIAAPASAQVQVSVTVTGPIEEILPILQLLQDAGIDATPGEGPQVEVHSIFEGVQDAPAASEAPQAPTPTPEAAPRLSELTVSPSKAMPGDQVRVTLRLDDAGRAVDTIAASIGDATGLSFDLYDNGTHGDETAGDGVWTHQLTIPHGVTAGALNVRAIAFDAFGDPVMVSGKPLEAVTGLQIGEGPAEN